MTLLCRFLDATGQELAPGITVEHPSPVIAYANARAFRNGVEQRVGVKVYLETREVG